MCCLQEEAGGGGGGGKSRGGLSFSDDSFSCSRAVVAPLALCLVLVPPVPSPSQQYEALLIQHRAAILGALKNQAQ